MMGPVRKVSEFAEFSGEFAGFAGGFAGFANECTSVELGDAVMAQELDQQQMTHKDEKNSKSADSKSVMSSWEPDGGWDAAFIKVIGLLTSERPFPFPPQAPSDPSDSQGVHKTSETSDKMDDFGDFSLADIKKKIQQGQYSKGQDSKDQFSTHTERFYHDAVLVFRAQRARC